MGKLSKNKKKKLKRKAKRQQRLLDERLLDLQRMEELDGVLPPDASGNTRALWRLSEDGEDDDKHAQSEIHLYIYIQLAQEENLIKLNHSFESCFNDSFELICKKCWFTWMKEGFVSWGTEIYYYFKNEALWNTLWGILWAIERLCTI